MDEKTSLLKNPNPLKEEEVVGDVGNLNDDSDDIPTDSSDDENLPKNPPISLPVKHINTPSNLPKDTSKIYEDHQNRVKKFQKCFRVFNFISPYIMLFYNNPNYIFLFFGGLISTLGNSLTYISVLTSIEQILGDNSSFIGTSIFLILLTKFLPPVLLMPFTGVICDIVDRRVLMIICDIARGILVLGLIFGNDFIYLFYIIYALMFSLNSFFDPARAGYIPAVVRKEDLVLCNNVDALSWMTCQMIGNFVGGLIFNYWGSTVNYIIDSISYFVSAVCIVFLFWKNIKKCGRKKKDGVDVESNLGTDEKIKCDHVMKACKKFGRYFCELFDGIVFFIKNPYIFSVVILKGLCALNWGALEVLNVRICATIFPIGTEGAITLGIVKAVDGLMNGLSPFFINFLLQNIFKTSSHKYYRFVIVFSYFLLAFATFLLYFSPNVWVYFVGYLIVGISGVWSYSNTIIQTVVPGAYIGRTIAFDLGFMLSVCLMLSNFVFGRLLDSGFDPKFLLLIVFCYTIVILIYLSIWYFCTVNMTDKHECWVPKGREKGEKKKKGEVIKKERENEDKKDEDEKGEEKNVGDSHDGLGGTMFLITDDQIDHDSDVFNSINI